MKCLSLKQPFAELLASGKKKIELRNWNTMFRGEFLIHASRNINKDACKSIGLDSSTIATGAVIGKAFLYDVKEYYNKKDFDKDKENHLATDIYSNDRYGFLVKDAVKFDKPIPMLGKLNFFEVQLDVNRV